MHQCVPALQIFTKLGGTKGRLGAIFHHFSIQCSESPVLPPPSTFSEQPTRAKKIQRHRHIGSIKSLYSLEPLLWGWFALRHYSTTELLQQLFSYPCGCVCFALVGGLDVVQDVLVDPLEALRILHRHEEFLSQVFKRLVSRQIQAVKTGNMKITSECRDRFRYRCLDEETIKHRGLHV